MVPPPQHLAGRIINELRTIADIHHSTEFRPLSGMFTVKLGEGIHPIWVVFQSGRYGESVELFLPLSPPGGVQATAILEQDYIRQAELDGDDRFID